MSIIILITATAKYGEYGTDSSCANRVRLSVPGRRVTQLTGANMRTVETPSAAGTGWRRTLSQLYRMIEAAQTSPLESLYERVLRLEQEVSALKRNLPMGSVDHERVDRGQPVSVALEPRPPRAASR